VGHVRREGHERGHVLPDSMVRSSTRWYSALSSTPSARSTLRYWRSCAWVSVAAAMAPSTSASDLSVPANSVWAALAACRWRLPVWCRQVTWLVSAAPWGVRQ
jgi:hypothetical protein